MMVHGRRLGGEGKVRPAEVCDKAAIKVVVLLSRSDSPFWRWVQEHILHGRWNHAALGFAVGGDLWVVEAWVWVRRVSWAWWEQQVDEWLALGLRDEKPCWSRALWWFCQGALYKPYAIHWIPALLAHLLSRPPRSLAFPAYHCSGLVADALALLGIEVGHPPIVQPNDFLHCPALVETSWPPDLTAA